MAKKSANANWRTGLGFALGNLDTLLGYVRRDLTARPLEAPQAKLFLDGPYAGWLGDAEASLEAGSLKDLKAAYLDLDRVARAFVRLCQYEYCAGKAVELRAVHFWDFEEYKWLEDCLPAYHPVHRELNELLSSLRPALGDPALEELQAYAGRAEKETFRFHARGETSAQIEGLQAELSGKLDDNVKSLEAETSEGEADLPIVDFVDSLLVDAAKLGAGEMEILPGPWRGIVQYRVGESEEFTPRLELPPEVTKVAIIRLKILAGLDIANYSQAQDGRIAKMPAPALVGRKITLSTTPTAYREKALIRLD